MTHFELFCGVSKSNVSREAAEAGEEALKELLERRFDEVDLLVIYLDGMLFGEHHVISAVGVDGAGTSMCSASNRERRKMQPRSRTYCSS
jgi:hypothetical protein